MRTNSTAPGDTADEALWTDREAETHLNMHKGFLAKDRVGPARIPFVKIGRAVRYRPADIRAFIAASTRASTSDAAS